MPDILSARDRSERMRLVRAKNTKPELRVRKVLTEFGFRYRLHGGALPGRPDIVLASREKVIFVHGCFWHRHPNCRKARLPKSRLDYWLPKLEGNRQRDLRARQALRKLGWNSLVVWECQTERDAFMRRRLKRFLAS